MRDWILSSEVSLQFMRPSRARIIACVSCGNDCIDTRDDDRDGEPVFRSTFWRMTKCSAGHSHALNATALDTCLGTSTWQTGICPSCDKDYVLQVVRGEHMCAVEGCRRRLRVNQDDVTDELWNYPGLLQAFIALVQTHCKFECAIHVDDVNDDMSIPPLTEDCDHDHIACAPCITRLCEAAIQGDRLDDLVCPEPACRGRLTRDTIRAYVSAPLLRLYDKKLAFATMARNPNFRWCRCGHGQLHEANDVQPVWTCGACKARHCFVCRDDRGAGGGKGSSVLCEHLQKAQEERALAAETAAQQRTAAQAAVHRLAVEKHENTRGTQQVIAGTTKRCPRQGCYAPIQLDAGCGHMTCRRCRTDFCWACKVIWQELAAVPNQRFSAAAFLPLHLTTCKLAAERTIERQNLDTALYASGWDVDEGYDESLDEGLWLPPMQQ